MANPFNRHHHGTGVALSNHHKTAVAIAADNALVYSNRAIEIGNTFILGVLNGGFIVSDH